MTTDRGDRVQQLFAAALERPRDERACFVAESGEDPEVNAEVASLLAAHEGRGRLDSILGRLRTLGPAAASISSDDVVSRLRASLGDRYRIEGELGRGGMAIVLLAEDLKHRRKVAVKILKPELAHDLGTARFLQEIAIVAQLAHPHILPLHDSGEADGFLYYVMPYVAGESLRNRLEREGRLTIGDALRIAREVADALGHAHEHDVIHRDIKPENILLVSSHAVVSDFGIARAMKAAGGDELTEAAIAIGTPAYMSPEQILGDAGLDGRSDVYSLGCVLHEMLSGEPPFRGATIAEVLDQHLASAPPEIPVPSAVASALRRALAKDPADRFSSAIEFDRDLARAALALDSAGDAQDALRQHAPHERGWLRALSRRTTLTIAGVTALVLGTIAATVMNRGAGNVRRGNGPMVVAIRPFRDAGGATAFGWLAAALETRLADALVDAPDLELRSTTAVAAYGSRQIPDDSLARLLDVDFFLDGQIVPSGDSIGVTVQLIDATKATVLEVGTVRQSLRTPSERLLDAVYSKVAVTLLPALGRQVRGRQWKTLAHDTLAVRLRYRAQERRWAGEALINTDQRAAARQLAEADSLLALSVRTDPRWNEPRLARAALAARRALAERMFSDTSVVRRILDDGISSAQEVLSKDPESAEALAYRGRLRWRKYLWAGVDTSGRLLEDAETDLRRAATAAEPVASAAQDLSEILYMVRTQFAEAREFAMQAYRLDAYLDEAGLLINRIALASLSLGYDVDADNWCRTGLRRYPDQPYHVACLLDVMAWGTQPASPDSALGLYRALISREPAATVRWHYLLRVAAVDARAGRKVDAAKLLTQVRREMGEAGADRTSMLPWEAGVEFRMGNTAAGERLFEQYRKQAPNEADVRANGFPLRGYVAPRFERPNG